MQTLQPFSGKLTKFYRQPKIYISLPSKGKWYPPGVIDGDPTNLPVFGMTAMDEIMYKTPDALFSGTATVSVIKSCVPAIKDPWQIPVIDLDTILIGIRIASIGEEIDLSITCKGCSESYDMGFDLLPVLSYFNSLEYDEHLFVDPLTFCFKPLTYKQQTDIQIEAYQMQKTLTEHMKNEDNQSHMDSFYKQLGKVTANSMKAQIEYIEADEDKVSNQQEILDWLNNSEKTFYDACKQHLDNQKQRWKIPNQKVKCEKCDNEQDVEIDLDRASFFGKS